MMDGHYYDDPIEDYEPDENPRYFAQECSSSGQTASVMNSDIGGFYDDLDLEYGKYMRVLNFVFTIFCLRTVFTITYESFGTFTEPLSKPSCPDNAIRLERQQAISWFRK
jgi:hypothetical protein